MAKQNQYLESKPRYEILDGLRGVAALMVIIFHLFETYAHGQQHVNHGYLAVDFFFVLSGFVIGYAYDDRWDRMTTWGFFKRRLTRLHPLVIMGTIIGACLFFFGAEAFRKIMTSPSWMFFVCLVMGFFMVPTGPKMDIRGWSEMNSFNGPNWTLTFEYIGNILYAFIFRRLPTIVLCVLAALAAVLTLDLTMGWDLFGLFPVNEFTRPDGTVMHFGGPQYHVKGGWSLTAQQIYIGFSRLLYPFLCGLIISRILPKHRTESNPSGSPFHVRGGFWWAALALVVIFSVPCIGGKDGIPNGLYQAVMILFAFPLIVLLGAGSKTTDPTSTKICKFLGDISYPIYITHYPLIYMHMDFARTHADAPLWIHIAVSAGVFFFAIIMAYGVFKMYDEPVRKWLTEHWLKGEQRLPRWLKITGCTLAVLALFSGLYHTNKLKFVGLTCEEPTVQTTRPSQGGGQAQSAPAPEAVPASGSQSSAPADSSSAEN
ncbi:MAG: acyltransferase [Bacteroidales bacterium]|nr:acyltransferase [Bacteroidales bacterium]